MNEDLAKDQDIILRLLKIDNNAAMYLDKDMVDYYEIMLKAAMLNGNVLKHLDKNMVGYKDFALLVVQKHPRAIEHLDKDMVGYSDIVLSAEQRHHWSIEVLRPPLARDPEFIKKVLKMGVEPGSHLLEKLGNSLQEQYLQGLVAELLQIIIKPDMDSLYEYSNKGYLEVIESMFPQKDTRTNDIARYIIGNNNFTDFIANNEELDNKGLRTILVAINRLKSPIQNLEDFFDSCTLLCDGNKEQGAKLGKFLDHLESNLSSYLEHNSQHTESLQLLDKVHQCITRYCQTSIADLYLESAFRADILESQQTPNNIIEIGGEIKQLNNKDEKMCCILN